VEVRGGKTRKTKEETRPVVSGIVFSGEGVKIRLPGKNSWSKDGNKFLLS